MLIAWPTFREARGAHSVVVDLGIEQLRLEARKLHPMSSSAASCFPSSTNLSARFPLVPSWQPERAIAVSADRSIHPRWLSTLSLAWSVAPFGALRSRRFRLRLGGFPVSV